MPRRGLQHHPKLLLCNLVVFVAAFVLVIRVDGQRNPPPFCARYEGLCPELAWQGCLDEVALLDSGIPGNSRGSSKAFVPQARSLY